MNRKWMPITAGILDIIYGGSGIFFGPIAFIGASLLASESIHSIYRYQIIGATVSIAGILSIIGGIFSIKIKKWPLALTGAICILYIASMFIMEFTIIPIARRSIPGIFAIVVLVFTILSRKQFEK